MKDKEEIRISKKFYARSHANDLENIEQADSASTAPEHDANS